MIPDLQGTINTLLGLDESALELGVDQMVIRAGIVYLFTLAVVRFGHKRFLGNHSAFDVVLGIILGSVISRAITGSAAFFPALAAGLALIVVHWLIAAIAYRWHWFGTIVKGDARVLIDNGEVRWEDLRRSHLSERDLEQALRENASLTDVSQVEEARLERSGAISIIPAGSSPRIIDVTVEQGIQTVRIKLE